jgi:hypothetical protein
MMIASTTLPGLKVWKTWDHTLQTTNDSTISIQRGFLMETTTQGYIWLLHPINRYAANNPWEPWYDCVFAQVVVAPNEQLARIAAEEEGGKEQDNNDNNPVWTDKSLVDCQLVGCAIRDGEDSNTTPSHPVRVLVVDRRLA